MDLQSTDKQPPVGDVGEGDVGEGVPSEEEEHERKHKECLYLPSGQIRFC